jgi:hypothetical protein
MSLVNMMVPSGTNNPQPQTQFCGDFANRRNYSGAPGAIVPVQDYDAAQLAAFGWIRLPSPGTTAQRSDPRGSPGLFFFDSTLGKTIVSDGLNWRDPQTGSTV